MDPGCPGFMAASGRWEIPNPLPHDMPFKWRQTIILKIAIDTDNHFNISKTFTQINNDIMIVLDTEPGREEVFDSLSKKFRSPFYKYWWRFYAMEREWSLRIKSQVSLKRVIRKIWKLRPKHLKELFKLIRRSSKVAKGNSTNPYE